MEKIILLLIIGLVLSVFTFAGNDDFSENSEESNVDKEELLRLVNEARVEGCRCGNTYYESTEPLTWNDQLEAAAQRHSDDMYRSGNFSHTGTDGSEMSERITDAGYAWSACGENISWGRETEAAVIAGWLDSPGHCKNIMNPDFTEMGVAKSGTYWTQVFGKQRNW